MKIYTDDFVAGIQEMVSLYKQGNNIFDMKDGALFPHNTSQKTWQISKGTDAVHLSDGTHTYSFKGELNDYDTELTRLPDAPLPDMFTGEANKKNRHRAQVHRSDPGSIYFTVQEGSSNPTYTLKHVGDNKWKAIPKPRKVKDMLKQPLTPHNVNLESVKEGMMKELDIIFKEGDGTGIDGFLGRTAQKAINLPSNIGLLPSRTGPVPEGGDSFGQALGNAGIAAGVGGLAGGAYHLAKRNLLNTQAENEQEDLEGGHGLKRVLAPAGIMAGMNVLGRQMLPGAVNNPELQAFPGK